MTSFIKRNLHAYLSGYIYKTINQEKEVKMQKNKNVIVFNMLSLSEFWYKAICIIWN